MPTRSSNARLRVSVRCDGDELAGAGHVARCLPLAQALRAHGWEPVLVGRYAGLAEWLRARAELETQPPVPGRACGLDPAEWDAAIVDLYGLPEGELCALAGELKVATLAEASRCAEAGWWIDYHLDRAGASASARELPGPAYAPLEPRLPALRRDPGREVRIALVTTGGSEAAQRIAHGAAAALRAVFPNARVLTGPGLPVSDGVEALAFPGTLLDAIAKADVAVSAAGLTAYELACAGVPAVLVGAAANQHRVLNGSRETGTALVAEERHPLATAVARLADPAERARIAASGIAHFDGAGAARTAAMLDRAWRGGDPLGLVLRRAVPGDCERLLAWRNDPLIRERSFTTGVVSAADHQRWLARTLADPDRRLFVAEQAGRPLGQLRLDRDGAEAEVSIAVAPAARGRGVAAAMLAAADLEAARWGLDCLQARVKPSNVRSLRLFRRNGYAETTVVADGERVWRRPVGAA